MTTNRGLAELIKDVLSPLGAIVVRRMFGGAGVYCDGVFFAILDGDGLYLKTDETGRGAFEAEGRGPFTYTMKSGTGTLASYYQAPERLFDEPDEMRAWALRAIGAARGATARAKASPKQAKPPAASRTAKRGPRRSRSKS